MITWEHIDNSMSYPRKRQLVSLLSLPKFYPHNSDSLNHKPQKFQASKCLLLQFEGFLHRFVCAMYECIRSRISYMKIKQSISITSSS